MATPKNSRNSTSPASADPAGQTLKAGDRAEPAKRSPNPAGAAQSEGTLAKGEEKTEKAGRGDGLRETVESIVVAFAFAFLFRTFVAEAFVIPTGSMAPTLLGRHKDCVCPECGFSFATGASEEIDQESGLLTNRLDSVICPNCRYRMEVRNAPVFAGDRILVSKFSYEVGEPDRWNVTVFKYPEDPSTNYIKRLVGLPNETLEIRQGDVYRTAEKAPIQILRKPSLAKQQAVLQIVYDDSYPSRELLKAGWPERWASMRRGNSGENIGGWINTKEGWQSDPVARTYRVAAGNERHWLRYRHYIPTPDDWSEFEDSQPFRDPQPRLILDFCGYNSQKFQAQFRPADQGVYWVGDLSVSATLDIEEQAEDASVTLELVEGNRQYQCVIDPNAGTATLLYLDALDRERDANSARTLGQASVPITGPGRYELQFMNIDDRLWLAVDGDAMPFSEAAYEAFAGQLYQAPTPSDLTPVGVAVRNLTATISNLRLERDLYYRAEVALPQPGVSIKEVETEPNEDTLHGLADRPQEYARFYLENVPAANGVGPVQFVLGEDEFLMLGDNSPRSLDGRLWSNTRGDVHRHAVPRNYLVGQALMIFWPHGLRFGNVQDGYAHGWTIPKLDWLFYHRARNGQLTDYPAYGVPFYPDFSRWFDRIR